jgi:hypothetical protein
MLEVTAAGEDHRDAVIVRNLNRVLVPPGAVRVD